MSVTTMNLAKDFELENDDVTVSSDAVSSYRSASTKYTLDYLNVLLIWYTFSEERLALAPSEVTMSIEICITSTYSTFKHELCK